MKEKFKVLEQAAVEIGCEKYVQEQYLRVEAVNISNTCKVSILGDGNTGKTTLINGMIGREIREPSLLPESSKPLRLVFQQTEEDLRFETEMVLSQTWNTEDAVLYELHFTDIVKEDKTDEISPLMYEMDVIFYTISANTLLTGNDMKMLKLLESWPVRIVIMKLNLLRETERERAIEYVNLFCSTHKMHPPLLFSEEDVTAIRRVCMDVLPDEEERMTARDRRIEQIYETTRAFLLAVTEQHLETVRSEGREADRKVLRQKAVIKENQSMAKCRKLEFAERFSEVIKREGEAIEQRILVSGRSHKYSEGWCRKSQGIFKKELKDAIAHIIPGMESVMYGDCHVVSKSLFEADLMEVCRENCHSVLPWDLQNKTFDGHPVSFSPEIILDTEENADIKKIALSGGIGMGVGLILPVSIIPAVAVGAFSAAMTYGMMEEAQRKEYEKKAEREIHNSCLNCRDWLSQELYKRWSDFYENILAALKELDRVVENISEAARSTNEVKRDKLECVTEMLKNENKDMIKSS